MVPNPSGRTLEVCPSCGLIAWEPVERRVPSAERFGASSSCWAAFSAVLDREYQSSRLFTDIHTLTIDSYSAQHPHDLHDLSLAVHLIRLYCVFELGWDTGHAAARSLRFARRGRDYDHLEAPPEPGELTVAHVLWASSELDHVRRVWEWAESVWQLWKPHHDRVAVWAERESC